MIIDLRPKMDTKRKKWLKMTALLAVAVMVLVQVADFSAWEAHIINVKAGVKNDAPMIWPEGRQFCDQSPVSITLTSNIATSIIYYTLDETEPECGVNGALYEGPFDIQESLTIKARTCHDGRQSAVMTWEFEVELEFCQGADHLLINKVYSDVGIDRGRESRNEWLELYNPTGDDIDLGGWQFCNHYRCAEIKPGRIISAGGFVILTRHHTTNDIWQIPPSVPVLDVNDYLGPGIFFYNLYDLVILKNPDSIIVDQMNYGEPNSDWPNFNPGTWQPGLEPPDEGNVWARVPTGQDTDTPADWQELGMPEIHLIGPNDCETWWPGEIYNILWQAENNNGPDEALVIDIYFTLDKGKHWLPIALGEANDGIYAWTVPEELYELGICWLNWDKEWIRIVATGPENFMIQSRDESRHDCCCDCNNNKKTLKRGAGHECQEGLVEDFDFSSLTNVFYPLPGQAEDTEDNIGREKEELPVLPDGSSLAGSSDETQAATTTDGQASTTDDNSQEQAESEQTDDKPDGQASTTAISVEPEQTASGTVEKKEEETGDKQEETGDKAEPEQTASGTVEKKEEETGDKQEETGDKQEEEMIVKANPDEKNDQTDESGLSQEETVEPLPAEEVIINFQATVDE